MSAENVASTETSVWYADGLRFTCTRCGACCTGAPGYVWVTDEELERIAEFLGCDVREVRHRYTKRARAGRTLIEQENGDCVFYDRQGKACTIYPVRPVQCRTWPFWPGNVANPQAWAATCQICPGAGRGRLHSADEITQAAHETKMR